MPEQEGTFPEQSVVITLEGMNVRITFHAWVLPGLLLLRNSCWIDDIESRIKRAEVEIRPTWYHSPTLASRKTSCGSVSSEVSARKTAWWILGRQCISDGLQICFISC
eukprot:Skav203471  [mRNA]  locus=scaffold921:34264:34743:- [translate_table: standard]